MKVQINGKFTEILEGISLKTLLEDQDYNLNLIAVECDENIIPKDEWENFQLKENMSVEIVQFVGGG